MKYPNKRHLSIALLLWLGSGAASGQELGTPRVPPEVSSVASGGLWNSADAAGYSRIVIVNVGFEHVHSMVWLEWWSQDERNPPVRRAQVLVRELSNGMQVVDVGRPDQAFRSNRIRLQATNTYASEQRTAVEIEVGAPGRYKISKGAR